MRLHASTGEYWNKPRERERGHQKGGVLEKRSLGRGLGKNGATTLVATILSLCLMGMLLCQGVQKAQADPFNDQTPCSIGGILLTTSDSSTPVPPDQLGLDDLRYQLFRVADALPVTGSDTYEFNVPESSSVYSATVDGKSIREMVEQLNGNSTSAQNYEMLAQDIAAAMAAGTISESPIVDQSVSSSVAPSVSAGLYLLVAYGENTVADPEGDALVLEGDKYVSKAYSDTMSYIFLPELIALPTKTEDSTKSNNTANVGDWIYSPVITLKPSVTDLSGSLVVRKTVDVFFAPAQGQAIGGNGATFVFQLAGYSSKASYDDGAAPIYSDVVSLTFYAAGTQSVTLSNVPMGAYIIATEAYSGMAYSISNPVVMGTVTANAEEPLTLDFDSNYIGNANKGGSVTNAFDYQNSNPASRTSGGWNWTQIYNGEDAQPQGGDVE